MLVHNIKGTSDRKPYGYSSWIRFWLDKKTCGTTTLCPCCNKNSWEVGGHVQKHGSNTRNYWYIIPLCKKCNNPYNTVPFDVSENQLVRVTEDD